MLVGLKFDFECFNLLERGNGSRNFSISQYNRKESFWIGSSYNKHKLLPFLSNFYSFGFVSNKTSQLIHAKIASKPHPSPQKLRNKQKVPINFHQFVFSTIIYRANQVKTLIYYWMDDQTSIIIEYWKLWQH